MGWKPVMRWVALLLMLAPAVAAAQAPDLRVMSFNIRLPLASDGANNWPGRRELAVRMIARAAPDLIGTQELWKVQGDDLVDRLPQYGWIGIDRKGGHADEHMGIFYRRDRLRLVEFGNFWLSETPEVPGSISWNHQPYPRMVTWAKFEMLRGGRSFYAFNTHLPHRPEDEPARLKGAALLIERIQAVAGDLPVVLTGDFNTTPDSGVHALLATGLADAWTVAQRRLGPAETFHAFTGKADRRIDWIFSRGFQTRRVQTITEHRGAVQTSDHFPVVADLRWL
jgi:endonuclease/exonuclease/phosphatase family metal-dependent hydrolase